MSLSNLLMNANHIGAAAGRFEIQRTNQALLIIYGVEVFGGASTSGPISNVLTLSLDTFPIPKQGNEVISVPFLNGARKVAGSKTLDEFDVVFKDFVDQPTAAVLNNWRAAVQDPQTERIGLASRYKRNAEVILLGPNGQNHRKYAIEGIWPSRMDHGDIDMASSEMLKITVTFQLDKMYPVPSTWGVPIQTPLANLEIGNVLQAGLNVLSQAVQQVG